MKDFRVITLREHSTVESSLMQARIRNMGVIKRLNTMYFVIYKSKPGAYWWAIKSDGNHETLAHSEILGSKAGCLHAINIVHSEAGDAKYRDETGEDD